MLFVACNGREFRLPKKTKAKISKQQNVNNKF